LAARWLKGWSLEVTFTAIPVYGNVTLDIKIEDSFLCFGNLSVSDSFNVVKRRVDLNRVSIHAQNIKNVLFAPLLGSRVARSYIFKPKIQLWVDIGVSCNERCW
jgi:hypothetical protein